MPTADRTMNNLILDFYLVDLDDVIKEYESRLISPDPVLEDDNCENPGSIQAQLCAYE